MQREKVKHGPLRLVGLTARTNNRAEMNIETSQIAVLAERYWNEEVAGCFKGRLNPGVTYAVYTDYESDEHGDYTYFIGEQVDRASEQDLPNLSLLDVSEASYQKFTVGPGPMPSVVIDAWQAIWQMDKAELGGQRTYVADFEVYDHRASDPNSAVVDVYIGVRTRD